MNGPQLARIGDTIREHKDEDVYVIAGHYSYPESPARPVCWAATFYPARPELGEPFTGKAPYDFTERDIAKPGALLAFADPWSTWTEP